MSSVGPTVIEPHFQERLDSLRTSYTNHEDLVSELERFVRTASVAILCLIYRNVPSRFCGTVTRS